MKQPHKHAEIIKAWADGVEVEFRFKDGMTGWSDWKPVESDGKFLTDPWWDYRIKPKPDFNQTMDVYMNKMYKHFPNDFTKQRLMIKEFALLGTMNLMFDGNTGKLKSAEVL